jgi:hypothetical protein
MDEGNFASNVMQGYSVDNLAPQVPESLEMVLIDDNFNLIWEAAPEPDFACFAIYKSDGSGQFGDEPDYFTIDPIWPSVLLETDPLLYAVKSFDHAGNASDFSEPVDAPIKLTIDLESGWSSLSGYLNPANPGLAEIFSGLENQVAFLNNLQGYWLPGTPHVTLQEWDAQSGYQIKMTEGATLELKGFFIHEQTVQLDQGWNLLPVLSNCEVSVEELYDLTGNNLVLIKDAVGLNVYWPAQEISTLPYLYPGKAYLIYLDQSVTLTFPVCD